MRITKVLNVKRQFELVFTPWVSGLSEWVWVSDWQVTGCRQLSGGRVRFQLFTAAPFCHNRQHATPDWLRGQQVTTSLTTWNYRIGFEAFWRLRKEEGYRVVRLMPHIPLEIVFHIATLRLKTETVKMEYNIWALYMFDYLLQLSWGKSGVRNPIVFHHFPLKPRWNFPLSQWRLGCHKQDN